MRRESSPEGVSSETDEQASSPLFDTFGINAGFVEDLREQFQVDPGSVDSSWAEHFGAGGEAARSEPTPSHARREASEAQKAELPRLRSVPAATEPSEAHGFDPNVADRHARVLRMIHAFRARGHRIARSDPLEGQSTYFPELDPAHYGVGHEDLDVPYAAGDLPGGAFQTLREILECLRATYCGP
ncbi:MAG: hypothetical protein O7A09_01540, partial [Proteobacteria bacterium]|nr:hypothetical protein [Pseudomonadota bacterium]